MVDTSLDRPIGAAMPVARRRGEAGFGRLAPSALGAATAFGATTALGAATLLTLVQLGLIVWRLGGHFSYSLDDPYIHLALADRIAQGQYGLNPGEAAAPSSSILFPVLLAMLRPAGLGQFAPLALCFAATLASALLIVTLLKRSLSEAALSSATGPLLALSLILSFNLIGLEFTGLEHALHVAVTLACLFGALRFLETGSISPWWWVCGLAEPLIRFEGAALWVGLVGLLLVHGRRAAGLGLLLAGAVLLGLFSLGLHRLGLPPLPSSVLVKSYVAAAGAGGVHASLFGGLAAMLAENALSFGMIRLVILSGLLGILVWRRPNGARGRIASELALLALWASVAHMLLGRFGWFSRYEIYVVALDVMVLAYGFGPRLDRVLDGATRPRVAIAALCPMAFLSAYPQTTALTSAAARNVFDQQYQMHRFVDDFYRRPVGVNDLGWVSYGSPVYTLDYWGLGSEEARRHRFADASPAWMDELARRHDVGLAMIYPSWFDALPPTWRRVARLEFEGESILGEPDRVTFYATRPEARAEIDRALDAFGASLPAGVTLERAPPPLVP